ncbi:MAG: YqgE/AlgH family protein [Puniceicoccales bacterium]|nr:YqgE/AlgH family protein [Puniceicoccales bacterium]
MPLSTHNFAGLVLLSNPQYMQDGEFLQSVIAIIQHQPDKGSMGLMLNRPLRLTLNDFDAQRWEDFDTVPVFKGGPVEQKRLILTAIEWGPRSHFLKWYLGLQTQQIFQLLSKNNAVALRAYCGYVGWAPGQLEEEMRKNFWLPVPMHPKEVFASTNTQLWHKLMFLFHPTNTLFNQLSINPSMN